MKNIKSFSQFLKDCKNQIERNTDISEDNETDGYLTEDINYSSDKAIDSIFEVFNTFLKEIGLEASNILEENFSEFYSDKYGGLTRKTAEIKNLMDKFDEWIEIFKLARQNMNSNLDEVLDNRIEYLFRFASSDVPNSFGFAIDKDTGNDSVPDEALNVSEEELLTIAESIFYGTKTKIDVVSNSFYGKIAVVSLI